MPRARNARWEGAGAVGKGKGGAQGGRGRAGDHGLMTSLFRAKVQRGNAAKPPSRQPMLLSYVCHTFVVNLSRKVPISGQIFYKSTSKLRQMHLS